MAEKTALASNSPQVQHLEYFLQLSLRASSARIISAHALSNPHLTVQFEKRCSDLLTVDAWLDASLLAPANSEDDVFRRGFVFSQTTNSGIRVPVGSLKVSNALNNVPAQNNNLRKAILCKIGIGRAYVNSIDGAAHDPLPAGYDSWYIPLEDDNIFKQSLDPDESPYYHEYFITNGAQILPLYVVQYEYLPEQERKLREKPVCDNCESALADVYCAADAANLCSACDQHLHSANKVLQKHVRTPIGKGADVFGHCRFHHDKLVEFFCSQCHVPVCVHCKMIGHHAAGEAAKHKLVNVTEAYQTVMSEAARTDTLLDTRKSAIATQLQQIASRSKQLDKHTSQIQSQIDDMYRSACTCLVQLSQSKKNVLKSDELELHRQSSEIKRLERFLAYQQNGDATQFLFSWSKHQQLRNELHEFRFFRDTIDVHLDIKCSGGIAVLTDSLPPTPTSPVKSVRSLAPSVKDNARQASPVGGMAGGPSRIKPLYTKFVASRTTTAPAVRKSPHDFFAEALGGLDDPLGSAGTIRDFVSELSFADGEGYISD